MRKDLISAFLVLMVVVIAGCSNNSSTEKSSTSAPFIGGSQGLKIDFVDNAPPKTALDTKQTTFDIILRVENVGEEDLPAEKAKVTISGLVPSVFGKTLAQLSATKFPTVLRGAQKDPDGDKITGEIDEVSFTGLSYQTPLEGTYEFPIHANVCYAYRTRAIGGFCLRKDLTKTAEGVCNVKGSKSIESSGGPIQVVSLDESIGGRDRVILKFKIQTVGNGNFFAPGDLTCNKGDFQTENFVKVTVNTGLEGLTCSSLTGNPPTGKVRLTNGEALVTCTQGNVNIDAVQTVNVLLEYNHLITKTTSIAVQHLPTGSELSGSTVPAGVNCIEKWKCSDWTVCSAEGQRTRTCTDLTGCGTQTTKPITRQNCDPPSGNTGGSNAPASEGSPGGGGLPSY
jgi:hypothetical protein